jgi:hypothetical protein
MKLSPHISIIAGCTIIAILIITGLALLQQRPGSAMSQSDQATAINNQETAYENILKDVLNVYHARYSHYPADYQTLLGDMNGSRTIYGINDQGMSELTSITSRLDGFVYTSQSGNNGYVFTYQKASTGQMATVQSN